LFYYNGSSRGAVLSPQAAEQGALRESTLKGAKKFFAQLTGP
jgi:hypothetical protein